MIKRYVCILAIVFLTMHPTSKANAATEALEQAVLNSFNWGTLVASLEERKATAIAMQAYWQNFASRIPSLSPAERAWMDEEFKKTGEPLQRLFRSEIFAIDRLNDTANGCYRGARRIRKKSYAKVFRASVRAETSRLPVCGSAARRNRRLG